MGSSSTLNCGKSRNFAHLCSRIMAAPPSMLSSVVIARLTHSVARKVIIETMMISYKNSLVQLYGGGEAG